jgi:hypothetical protein
VDDGEGAVVAVVVVVVIGSVWSCTAVLVGVGAGVEWFGSDFVLDAGGGNCGGVGLVRDELWE